MSLPGHSSLSARIAQLAQETHKIITSGVQKSKYVPLSLRRRPNFIYSIFGAFIIMCTIIGSLAGNHFKNGIQYRGRMNGDARALTAFRRTGKPVALTEYEEQQQDLGRLGSNSPIGEKIIDVFKLKDNTKFASAGFASIFTDENIYPNLRPLGDISCQILTAGLFESLSLADGTVEEDEKGGNFFRIMDIEKTLTAHQVFYSDILPFEVSETNMKLINQNSEHGLIDRSSIWLDQYSIYLSLSETYDTKKGVSQLLLEPFDKNWNLVTNSHENDGKFQIKVKSYAKKTYGQLYSFTLPRIIEFANGISNLKMFKIYNQFGDEEPFIIYESSDSSLYVYNILNQNVVKLEDIEYYPNKWMLFTEDADSMEGTVVNIISLFDIWKCDVISGNCQIESSIDAGDTIDQADQFSSFAEKYNGSTVLYPVNAMLSNIEGLKEITGIDVDYSKSFYVGFLTLRKNSIKATEAIYGSSMIILVKDTKTDTYKISYVGESLRLGDTRDISSFCAQDRLPIVKNIAAWDIISINEKTRKMSDYMVLNTNMGKIYYYGLINHLLAVGGFDKKYTGDAERFKAIDLLACELEQSEMKCNIRIGSHAIEIY